MHRRSRRLLHLAPRAQGGGHHPRVRVRGCRATSRGAVRKLSLKGSFPLSRHCLALQVLSWSTATVTARAAAHSRAGPDGEAPAGARRRVEQRSGGLVPGHPGAAVAFSNTHKCCGRTARRRRLTTMLSRLRWNLCRPPLNRSWTTEKVLPRRMWTGSWSRWATGGSSQVPNFVHGHSTFPEQYSGLDFQMPVLDATGLTYGAPSGALRFAWSLDPLDWTYLPAACR